MRQLFILLFLMVNSFKILSQENLFEQGYLVTLNGDTVQGQIVRMRDNYLTSSVKFQPNDGTASRTYLPFEITGFGFKNSELYFESLRYTQWGEHATTTTPRFGKLQLAGYASLFEVPLTISEKDMRTYMHFDVGGIYILKKDTSHYTLDQYLQINPNTQTKLLIPRYRGVMTLAMQDCPYIQSDLTNLPFNEKALTKMAINYNKCRFPKMEVTKKNSGAKSKWRFGVEGAYTHILKTSKINGGNGVFFDLLFSKYNIAENERAWITTGLGVMFLNTENKDGDTKSGTLFRVPIMLHYYTKKDAALKPFFNAGATPTDKELFLNIGTGLAYKNFFCGLLFETNISDSPARFLSFRAGSLIGQNH